MQQDKVKYAADKRLFLAETIMTMMFSFNANTVTRIYDLCDMLDSTKTSRGLERHGINQRFALDGASRSMFSSLRNKCDKYNKKVEILCHGYMTKIANAMDAAQDVLDPFFDAVERYTFHKASRRTLSNPIDPELFSRCISCLIFLDMSSTFFDDITSEKNFSEFNDGPAYRFLRMNQLYDQLKKVFMSLPWRDTDGDPLIFNVDAVIHSDFTCEAIVDLMHMFYSAEFADIVIEAREGRSMHFTQYFKSFVDRFTPETLTVEEYKHKYNNKQWTSHFQA